MVAKGWGGDTKIAEAFIDSSKGNKSAALETIAGTNSPNTRSAFFSIVGNHDGPQQAIKWLRAAGFDANHLDPDGKLTLLSYQLELSEWVAARETAEGLSDSDLEEAPVLHFMKAMAYLLDTVPEESRESVNQQVPFKAAGFAVDSSAKAIEARRTARSHFAAAAQAAKELDCHRAATVPERYALWLELEDWEHCDRGRQRLAARLGDLESALYLVPLALQYGIPLELDKVEQEIERQIALRGEVSPDAASARLALAFEQETPKAIANYLGRHYDTIASHTDTTVMLLFQTELFALAGKPRLAKEHLEKLQKLGISKAEESRLGIVMANAEGSDTLEARKKLFRQTDSIVDLRALVNELEARRDWSTTIEFGEILFEQTHYLRDAERLAHALHLEGKSAKAIELIKSNVDLLSQSPNLQMCYCWSLYHEGELLEAQRELGKLDEDWEDEYYRHLQINLAVALEDRDSLSVAITSGYGQTENRSAQELVRAAELSLSVSPHSTKRLLFAATEKGNDDAHVLSYAYFLAVKAGWEADTKIASWLQRAFELSGEDGPLRSVTLSDLLDMIPEWDRQELNIRKQLNRGEAPLFFAAQLLNRSLIKLMLSPALANSAEHDLRRIIGIPAFSGQRGLTKLVAGGKIGLDYTALLTLGFLGLLDQVFDAFSTVYVPHSTFAWLLEERQNASHHQPNEVKNAQLILDLLRQGSLETVSPNTQADKKLTVQVGEELATLIAEAEDIAQEGRQRLVVRPNPVHKILSLGEEEADLTRHYPVLRSCQAIVRKLYDLGEIDESVEKSAGAYLQRHEKPWPNQPEIADNAILYLDNLSVHYLIQPGVLEILCRLKFKLIVSPSLESESNAHIAYERFSEKIIDAIENMGSVVRQGVDSGKVKIGKRRNIGNGNEQYLNDFQIAELFALVEDCEAIIVDDRFFNQNGYIEHRDVQASLYTTFDLLDTLVSAGQLSDGGRQRCRTKLRRAGYYLIPLTEDELATQLNAAEVKNGKVIERAHLRAIRESILHARMNDWLQLPKEGVWLDTHFKVFVHVLRGLWRAGADIPSVEARSSWILDQVDVHGWTHCLGLMNREETIKAARLRIIFELITPLPVNVPLDIRESYWQWVEELVLMPIKELEPDLFNEILILERRHISELANADMEEWKQHDE